MKKYWRIAAIVVAPLVGACIWYAAMDRYTTESAMPAFQSRVSEFSDVAQKFGQRGPGNFCKVKNGYDVNGDFFNVKDEAYFIGGGPLGGDTETTYDKLLQNVSLTDSQYKFFKEFLDRTPFVECIEVRVTANFTGVEFQLPYSNASSKQKGYLYAVRGNPDTDLYTEPKRLEFDNWYEF